MSDPRESPHLDAPVEHWEAVVEDMAATAEEYEAEGWRTLQLHPGDVRVREAEPPGFEVLAPDSEYDRLAAFLNEGVAFDDYRVFAATDGGLAFLVVAAEDGAADTAVLFPLYYDPDGPAAAMFEAANERGALVSRVRRLSGEYVDLEHTDPGLFRA
ncbi:MAG: hypothetical protein ABEH77_06545 [Halobacteriaceae archaeon]